MPDQLHLALADVFSELTLGAPRDGSAVVLNGGDAGLLRSLDRLSAADASQSAHGGATIAAHAEHLRYGLSLMNRWAREGGNPFADATWDEAWKLSVVDDAGWAEIRTGLAHEVTRWLESLRTSTATAERDLRGLAGSVAHLAYHLGAIRQVARASRGPREGTFA